MENAIGFCVLHDGSVVSHCATDSVSGARCVGTEPAYRRLGLGKAAAAATITECIKRGRPDIEWHTHASNKGSIAIARSIGLIESDRHLAYSGNLPAENVGDLDLDTWREWRCTWSGQAITSTGIAFTQPEPGRLPATAPGRLPLSASLSMAVGMARPSGSKATGPCNRSSTIPNSRRSWQGSAR
ncbi:GNAT family N-acetyltransferase [Ensifer sp. ENS04]|nr:GNAT family N-acetyltransferase [Ensifer sp. ENS04]